MDAQQEFGYAVDDTDFSYAPPQHTPLLPDLFERLKVNLRDSPTSPFSTYFDFDANTLLNDSQEEQSSKENLRSRDCTSSSSPSQANTCFLDSSPSTDRLRDSGLVSSSATAFGESIAHMVEDLKTTLMENDGGDKEASISDSSSGKSSSQWRDQRPILFNLDLQVSYAVPSQSPSVAFMGSEGHNEVSSETSASTGESSESARMGNDLQDHVITSKNPSVGESRQPRAPDERSRDWKQDARGSHVIHSHPLPAIETRRPGKEAHAEDPHSAMKRTLLQSAPAGNLKHLLIACAKALSDNRLDEFDKLVGETRSAVSIFGEPIQRLGAYMVEGLVAKKESSGTNIYRALKCKEPRGKDLLSYMHILYEICPYLKFGYMTANGAIAEACKNEDQIHIIDFQIAQGTQWMTLLQALASRPHGAPRVRITGIDDPVSKYAREDSLELVGKRLAAVSEKFHIPVEFHAVPVFASDVTVDMLDIRPGEALAVNFPLQLHHIPDESVDVSNPRDGLLRMIKSFSPKVVTLVEQESNTNTTPFFTRFVETLDFYSAMFESIDVTMARDSKERVNVEQHCLARDIVNIISCEGKDRVERHELFGKWKSRFTMAGFQQYPLSSYVNSVIRNLLARYSEHYTYLEKDGAMLLGWKERMLISASAWY